MQETNSGSQWSRWDPHVHAPGTLQNDQFNGTWDQYIDAVESARPRVRALGVTDYCVLRSYKRVCEFRGRGRLEGVPFIFPNVELRLTVTTKRSQHVNVHLLFSPREEDHVTQIERFLARLKFRYQEGEYGCAEEELVRLGRVYDPTQSDYHGALRAGVRQFKVDINQIEKLFAAERWMRRNCLIALAGSGVDGLAGVREAGGRALQDQIGRLAHIVFSGNPADREYWLGEKPGIGQSQIAKRYGFLKPCLHGSDAHSFENLLTPDENRYCWILGDLSFDGLQQAVMEPARRVFVGMEPPTGPTKSETIGAVRVEQADWIGSAPIPLNSGLVAIIGARGSGKTALADVLARGADSIGSKLGDASFLGRARGLLGNARVVLDWRDGAADTRQLGEHQGPGDTPRVRYLSQRFVEKLCSFDGIESALLKEIETVVFHSVEETDRLGAVRFKELREMKVAASRQQRDHLVHDIERLSREWAADQELLGQLAHKKKRLAEIEERIKKISHELTGLAAKGDAGHAKELAKIQSACANVSERIQTREATLVELDRLELDVVRGADNSRDTLAAWKLHYSKVGISESDWAEFRQEYVGNPAAIIERARDTLRTAIQKLRVGADVSDESFEVALDELPLSKLDERRRRFEKLVGLDETRSRQYQQLQRELTEKKLAVQRLNEEIAHVEGAPDRQRECIRRRRAAYTSVFQTLVDEQHVLESLYQPLSSRLSASGQTLKGLEFVVRRRVKIGAWVEQGEGLFDLRQATLLKGKGKLEEVARDLLLEPWRSGDATSVGQAMDRFIKHYAPEIINAQLRTSNETQLDWFGRMAAWLFNTEHVKLEYSVRYAGTEVERLSPGMRGIVLLVLYLAVDEWDTRPLIVDQPEDNLDPQSVFGELVKYFREARTRRQIILVTHNANLVVNADADQVIVAESEPRDPGSLPRIRYQSGGLDEKRIRDRVCDLLEGGEEAFRERAKRYRLEIRGPMT